MTKFLMALLPALLVFGCRDSPYANMADEEIHARAQTMALPQRYAFYLEVLESRVPRNETVADDIVLLGTPARDYTISQALGGKRRDLSAALSVLSAFDGRCTPAELNALKKHAVRVAYDTEDLLLINRHILVACEIATPPGYRNPWN